MLKHIKGDIFESGAQVILHQVNCQGVMGSGVAKQVREKYPIVFEYYKSWCNDPSLKPGLLGQIQAVYTDDTGKQAIVNLFNTGNMEDTRPLALKNGGTTAAENSPGGCVDHIFIRKGFGTDCVFFKTLSENGISGISDHRPLLDRKSVV